jgi:hypothetical protein
VKWLLGGTKRVPAGLGSIPRHNDAHFGESWETALVWREVGVCERGGALFHGQHILGAKMILYLLAKRSLRSRVSPARGQPQITYRYSVSLCVSYCGVDRLLVGLYTLALIAGPLRSRD